MSCEHSVPWRPCLKASTLQERKLSSPGRVARLVQLLMQEMSRLLTLAKLKYIVLITGDVFISQVVFFGSQMYLMVKHVGNRSRSRPRDCFCY